MDFKNFFTSKIFAAIALGMAALVVVLVVFQAGVSFGHRRAYFSCAWADRYQRDFGPAPGRGMMPRGGEPNGHGAIGQIVSIKLPSIIVGSDREPDKTIIVATSTPVTRGRDRSSVSDLKVGDRIVVIGRPDDQGEVDAVMIRILP